MLLLILQSEFAPVSLLILGCVTRQWGTIAMTRWSCFDGAAGFGFSKQMLRKGSRWCCYSLF